MQKEPEGVRYSLFNFQNHLVELIYSSALKFSECDYLGSFYELSQLYADTSGFIPTAKRQELKKRFEELCKYANAYAYSKRPNPVFPLKLIEFRRELMMALTDTDLLIPVERDGFAQAVFKR